MPRRAAIRSSVRTVPDAATPSCSASTSRTGTSSSAGAWACRTGSGPGRRSPRQTDALLALLDALDARATFFVLGMAARGPPGLLGRRRAAGHEIGCHGDAHLPVAHARRRAEFAQDLGAAKATIEDLTGRTPIGYRAPAFSITATRPGPSRCSREQGFSYDASQHDSPRDPRPRRVPATQQPHRLASRPVGVPGRGLAPAGANRPGRRRVLLAGPPARALILTGLERAGPLAGLYLHPQRLDPQPAAGEAPARRHAAQQRPCPRARGPAQRRPPARPTACSRRSGGDST